MPTLDRAERQRLRAIQDNLINQALQVGSTYEQLGTVGIVFHPQLDTPDYNYVVPHRGVAWTRSDDVELAFRWLTEHKRKPGFQFLETLFPDAFRRQLELKQLYLQKRERLWLFEPQHGPFLEDEIPFGNPAGVELAPWQEIRFIEDDQQHTLWRELVGERANTLITPQRSYRWFGFHKQQMVAGVQLLIDQEIAFIQQPIVKPNWQEMGLEAALFQAAIDRALSESCRMIYTIETNPTEPVIYRQIGFLRFTALMLYGYDEAETNDNPHPKVDLAAATHSDV